jgi:hypothetical protein
MPQGWVYVLVNSSIPGLAKVGRTTRPPAERVAELSAATGVPTPFVLAFEQAFAECEQAERDIHAELDRRGCRLAANREFFRGSPNEIVRVVLQVASVAGDGPEMPPAPSAEALLAQGDTHLFGAGENLQDLAEACRCYRLAATRGSLIALERLGAIYAQIKPRGRTGRRRALRQLKDGAQRGNYYCFIEMAALYAAEGHVQNCAKAWDFFFSRRADSFRADVEGGPDRYVLALRRYIQSCLDHGLAPGHLDALRSEADAIIRSLVAAIDESRNAPETRHLLTVTLRWAYETLTDAPPAARRNRKPGLFSTLVGRLRDAPA